jgi:hypothetical protein
MSILIPTCGQLLLLQWQLKDTTTPENLTLKLYKNDYTPIAASVAGSFTIADFTGYVSKTLNRASWAAPSTVSAHASTSYAEQTWSPTSGQTIYGYYVVGATSTTLIYAERFATAKVLQSGDTLRLTPTFTLTTE